MNFLGVSTKLVVFKHILIILYFGTLLSSQFGHSNPTQPDPPKNRNAIASGVDNLFKFHEVFVKDNMKHLFYKSDMSTLRDDVNFDEVVVCKTTKRDYLRTYGYIVCPDDAGYRWPSYSELIRDNSNGKTYCCHPAGCCSKEDLYNFHPEFRPTQSPSVLNLAPVNVGGNSNNAGSTDRTQENVNNANNRNFSLEIEAKPKKKMATSTIVIIVFGSVVGVLILVAITCAVCCLCCGFRMFNSHRKQTGAAKVGGGYATNAVGATTGSYPAGGYATTAAATAYPASSPTYPAASGGYAGGYAGGYNPASVR